jgi:hypothetical protein
MARHSGWQQQQGVGAQQIKSINEGDGLWFEFEKPGQINARRDNADPIGWHAK